MCLLSADFRGGAKSPACLASHRQTSALVSTQLSRPRHKISRLWRNRASAFRIGSGRPESLLLRVDPDIPWCRKQQKEMCDVCRIESQLAVGREERRVPPSVPCLGAIFPRRMCQLSFNLPCSFAPQKKKHKSVRVLVILMKIWHEHTRRVVLN